MLRPAFVVTLAASALGCCPSEVKSGDPCRPWQRSTCQGDGTPGECGLQGYSCHDGKWREDFMYCNPAAPMPPPKAAPRADAGAATADGGVAQPRADANAGVGAIVGLTLKDALTRLGLHFDDLLHHDEPPGKLRSVSISARKNDGVYLRLFLRYEAEHGFDDQRRWPPEKIGKLRVAGVVERRVGQESRWGDTPEGP